MVAPRLIGYRSVVGNCIANAPNRLVAKRIIAVARQVHPAFVHCALGTFRRIIHPDNDVASAAIEAVTSSPSEASVSLVCREGGHCVEPGRRNSRVFICPIERSGPLQLI